MTEVILIDGKNFCWRHAWTRRMLRASNGFPTGCIYGILAGMIRLNRIYPNAALVYCWDGERTDKSWRNKMAASYKANRKHSGEKPQEVKDVYKQIPAIKLLLARMGFLQLEVKTLEADDLIGLVSRTLSKKLDKVYIYSSDKDFYQLMQKNVYVIRDLEKSKKCRPHTEKEVLAKHHVTCADWNKYRAFVGDPGDNVRKPVKGMGPKTAIKLLAAGTDPSKHDGCKDKKSKAYWGNVRTNYKLVKIVRRADDKRLPESIKEQVQAMTLLLEKSSPEVLYRTKEGRSHKSYRAVLKTLADYELETVIESRQKLWAIA